MSMKFRTPRWAKEKENNAHGFFGSLVNRTLCQGFHDQVTCPRSHGPSQPFTMSHTRLHFSHSILSTRAQAWGQHRKAFCLRLTHGSACPLPRARPDDPHPPVLLSVKASLSLQKLWSYQGQSQDLSAGFTGRKRYPLLLQSPENSSSVCPRDDQNIWGP